MMWVGVLLALGTVTWFLWAVKHERSERIALRELHALVELARCNTFVAVALAHREAIRETRGDLDGTDPVLTDVDRCVREVARTSQRLLRAKARRDRAATRQSVLGSQTHRSGLGTSSDNKTLGANVDALGQKLRELDEALAVFQREVDRMLAHLARVRETEQAKLAARLRPRRPLVQGEVSGLSRLASRAAQVVREATQPRARLASANGAPLNNALSEGTSAPRPAPPLAAAREAAPVVNDTVPDAAPVASAPARPRPRSRPRAPAAAALGRHAAPHAVETNKASTEPAPAERPKRGASHRRARQSTGRQGTGRQDAARKDAPRKGTARKGTARKGTARKAIGRIEVRTSPAVKPLLDRSEASDPERTLVHTASPSSVA